MATEKQSSTGDVEGIKNLPGDKSRNIETLVKSGNIAEAHRQFRRFLEDCSEEADRLILSESQLADLLKQKNANLIGSEADFRMNLITFNFLTLLEDFRRKTLGAYFDTGSRSQILENIHSRDAVINEILSLRLRPKRFQLVSRLDEGNSSIIYLLRNVDTRRHAIAMVLKAPELSDDMKNEIALLTDLRHRNVIKLLDHDLNLFPSFVVTEHIYGENMVRAIASVGPRPLAQAMDWLYQLTDALDYLRHKKIIHTNVRPSKIFIDDEWQIVISPFDLNKVGAGENTLRRYRDLCQYGSPELLEADGSTRAHSASEMCISDQYSLGLIAYKMLTGKDLFAGKQVHEMLESRRRFVGDAEYRQKRLNEFPEGELRNILSKLLEERPEARYRSLHEVLRYLHPYTRTDFPEANTLRQSYRRCLSANKSFIRDFYAIFRQQYPSASEDFNPISEKRQSAMLQMAIDLMIDVDHQAEMLQKLLHADQHKKYDAATFKGFLDGILQMVSHNDMLWDTVRPEWEAMRDKVMAVLARPRD